MATLRHLKLFDEFFEDLCEPEAFAPSGEPEAFAPSGEPEALAPGVVSNPIC